MNTLKIFLTTLWLISLVSFPSASFAAPGEVDLSFHPGQGVNDYVYAVAFQPDGKAILGGVFTSPGTLITRLNTNGAVDTNFNVGTGANGVVYAVAVQSNGKIIVAGSFTRINGVTRNRVARLNSDGSLDTSFDPGIGVDERVRAVAVLSNGKVLIGGDFLSVSQTPRARIARLNADGTLDSGFNPGSGADQPIYSVAVQPADGKVIVSGYFLSINGSDHAYIARLNANGSVDDSFTAGADFDVDTLALQSDGRIVIGGGFTVVNGTSRPCVARLNEDGSLDDSFNPGTGADLHVNSVVVQADGKILAGGNFGLMNGFSRPNIARLNEDGSVDQTFNPQNGTDSPVYSVAHLNGRALLGGAFRLFNGLARNYVTRLNTDGSGDEGFVPNTGADYPVVAVAAAPGGKVLLGGYFTRINGVSRNYVARLHGDGALDTNFVAGLGANNRVATVVALPDGRALIGGLFTTFNGTNRSRIARLNADGGLDVSFNPGLGGNGDVLAVARAAEGKVFVVGEFTTINGTNRNRIARLNAEGGLDLSFAPSLGASATVRTVAVQPDGKVLLGGDFTSVNGTNRNRIARFHADGSLDVSFDPGTGASGPVNSLVRQADGKVIVGGEFTSVNGTNRNRIARLNAGGGVDLSFAPGVGADGIVFSVALRADGKVLLGGDFFTVGGVPRAHVALLHTNGTLDAEFNPGTGANDTVSGVAWQPDGQALACGFFNHFNGVGRSGVVRLGGTLVRPTLRVALSEGGVITSWPAAFADYALESAGATAGGWTNVPSATGEVAGQFVVTNGAAAGRKIFRLKSLF